MKPDARFLGLPKSFWAGVRLLSQEIGYTVRGKGLIRIPTTEEVDRCLTGLSTHLGYAVIAEPAVDDTSPLLHDYFQHRADVLNDYVRPRLMDAAEAEALFEEHRERLNPSCPLPMNKQKGEKRAHAFLTGLVNMIVEANADGLPCDYDPRKLTTITRDGIPLRTMARRVDGAFTSAIDPVAIWELKEYYYTTTFGSRVADGVYETLLDGMELEELREHEGVDVRHYLMVDARYTWWDCGRSYLCRMVDMVHMGYVDEVLFGREVVERLPGLVREWVSIARARKE